MLVDQGTLGCGRDVASISDVLTLCVQFGKHWLVVEEHEKEGYTKLYEMPSLSCS